MNTKLFKNQSGVSSVAVLIIIGVVAIGSYAVYMLTVSNVSEDGKMTVDDKIMGEKNNTIVEISPSPTSDSMMKDDKMIEDKNTKNDGTMMEPKFAGQVLAGISSPLLDFNKDDYDKAIASDKLVALYFYANWCPICKAEFPKMQEAFNKINDDKVVGFRINYNDNQTDDYERALAKEFGVAYQHTKVFVKNGQRILKAPESWSSADIYISKINENK